MLKQSDYQLRKMLEKDLKQVLAWRNSDRIRACMYTDKIISWDEHYDWYQKTLDNQYTINMICEFQGQPIGVSNITQIDRHNSKCLWGFYIGNINAPKGSGYAMGLQFLDFIFNNLSLRKVCSEVLGFNHKSIDFHHNLGFQQEGILKEHVLKQNIYVDVVIFGLLSKEWNHKRVQTENQLFTHISD